MERNTERNLELERLIFFSDAVVAIAITLLALDLKIEMPTNGELTFEALGKSWKSFTAFFLSFLMIAVFWTIHHRFFYYIKQIDQRMLFVNLAWLLFIVMLPFATTLISEDFTNTAAVFVYSTVIFLISVCQNFIWDYATTKPEFTKEHLTNEIHREFRTACNLAMVNGLIAMILAFISPIFAFITLFTRTIMFRRSAIKHIEGATRRQQKIEERKNKGK